MRSDNATMNWRLCLPWHWLVLLSGAKNFRDNPVLGHARLNALGLHVLRKRLAHAMCARRRKRLARALPTFLRDQYDAQGYVQLPDFLPRDQWLQLLQELRSMALPMLEMAQPPALTRRAYLDAASCAHMPATLALLSHRMLKDTMNYVAGYPGTPIITLQCIYSDAPAAQMHDPQTEWHTDTFHSTAKAWLFLHDVQLDEGPFAFIPGSHTVNPSRQAWEQTQSEQAAQHAHALHAKGSWRASPEQLFAMGYGPAFIAAVPANTLIVADTGGFHRRTPVARATVRLEVYLSLRRNPFFAGIAPSLLSWPWIAQHWGEAYVRLSHALHLRGFKVWTPASEQGLQPRERERLSPKDHPKISA